MLLSELAEKELIEVKEGARYGFLANTECVIDIETGRIKGFELQPRGLQSIFQSKGQKPVLILWEHIVLIGENRVLFRLEDE